MGESVRMRSLTPLANKSAAPKAKLSGMFERPQSQGADQDTLHATLKQSQSASALVPTAKGAGASMAPIAATPPASFRPRDVRRIA